jgi:hypothetical protein
MTRPNSPRALSTFPKASTSPLNPNPAPRIGETLNQPAPSRAAGQTERELKMTKDPVAEADDDIAYWTGAIGRAEALLEDIRGDTDTTSERIGDAVSSVATDKAELESANKIYLDSLEDDDDHCGKQAKARRKVGDAAASLHWAEENLKAAVDAERPLVDLKRHMEDYVRRLRLGLAKAQESHAGALATHEKLQAAIVQELETLLPGFAKGEVPIAKLWDATLAAGHLGFVYKGRVPDGAEYRYAKAKEALVKSGRLTEAKGFCVLNAAGEKVRVLALLDYAPSPLRNR